MKPWTLWAGVLIVLVCIPAHAAVPYFEREKEKAIYDRIEEYGITLDDVVALKRVYDEEKPATQKPVFREPGCSSVCPGVTEQEKKAAVDALYEHIQRHGIHDLPDEPSDKEATTRWETPFKKKTRRIQKKVEEIRSDLKFRDPTPEDISAIKRLQEAEIYTSMRYYGIHASDVAFLKHLYEPSSDDARIHLSYKEREAAIYEHMKRYGINRDDVEALGRLSLYVKRHVMVDTNDLLKPGEHYRMEMDGYILTMKAPDALKMLAGQRIWPYTDTFTPDPMTGKMFGRSGEILKVADLAFYIRPSFIFGRTGNFWGGGIYYQILTDENRHAYLTPETVRKYFSESQKGSVLTQEEIERSLRKHLIDNRMGNKIILTPELVTINGRIWIREAIVMNAEPLYRYTTVLKPDRRLHLSIGLPDDRRAYEKMEEMIASIRVAKIDDDGSPDPFVIERVEPAPLPVREPLPSSR